MRSIGLFGIVELIRDSTTRQPLAPFNGSSEEMVALGQFFRREGLYTLVRWNSFYTNPPLCITEAELREAFAVIDRGPRSPIARCKPSGLNRLIKECHESLIRDTPRLLKHAS